MEEDLKLQLEMTKDGMFQALKHLEAELSKIRAGKANIHILDGITVEYYGAHSPISQVANISTPDPKMVVIQPWDKKIISEIEKAIMKANIGITPMNDGELIRLAFPPLTEERRLSLVKQVKNEGETAKVSIRNHRREANEELKKMKKDGLPEDMEKDGEATVQKMTDDFIRKVEEIIEKKEREIMTI